MSGVLPLGLLEAHLHIASGRDEAVDNREDEDRDGIEDVLSGYSPVGQHGFVW